MVFDARARASVVNYKTRRDDVQRERVRARGRALTRVFGPNPTKGREKKNSNKNHFSLVYPESPHYTVILCVCVCGTYLWNEYEMARVVQIREENSGRKISTLFPLSLSHTHHTHVSSLSFRHEKRVRRPRATNEKKKGFRNLFIFPKFL